MSKVQLFKLSSFVAVMKVTELVEVIESLKKKHLSIKFRPVKLMFCGPPRVGKSTLKKRLLREIANLATDPTYITSTGLEKPQVVQVSLSGELERSAFIISAGKMSAHDWRDQDLHQQIGVLFNTMLQHKADESGSKAQSAQADLDQGSGHSPDHPDKSQNQDNPLQAKVVPGDQNCDEHEASEFEGFGVSAPTTLHDEIKEVAQSSHWVEARILLRPHVEDSASVYVMDTGGQPEFHEVLPHVLKPPALFLVFFSLLEAKDGTDCLDRQFTVEYASEDGEAGFPYKSVYPVKEVLFQLLSSFHSLQEPPEVEKGQSFGQSLLRSQAILVGTYKDKLLQKFAWQKELLLDAVNRKIAATFKGARFLEKSFLSTVPAELQCVDVGKLDKTSALSKEDRLYVAVDNMHGTKEEMSAFRNFLSQRIFEVAKPIELPCSVLLFHLLLRYRYEDDPGFCTLDESLELALKCHIAAQEMKAVLKYLHITLGTVLYYEEVDSLKDIVFCNPNLLLSHINQLIAVCFTGDPTVKLMANTTRESGVIEPELFEHVRLTTKSKQAISNKQVIDFLLHCKLMMKIRTGSEEKLFMPCLLLPNPTAANITTKFLKELCTVPLLIQFYGKVIPLGQFTSLVVQLCQQPWESCKPWEAAIHNRYRNQITFLTDSLLRIKFTARLQFIEVLVEGSATASQVELSTFCTRVWKHVTKAIEDTNLGNKFECGFYCPGSFSSRQAPHFATALNRKVLGCSQGQGCDSRHPCPPEASIWFEENKVQYVCTVGVKKTFPFRLRTTHVARSCVQK